MKILDISTNLGKGAMKGISPIIATAIMIIAVFGIDVIIVPWALALTRTTTTATANTTQTELLCQGAGLTWDTTYCSSGLIWNRTGSSDSLSAKVINSGMVSLWGFSFELQINRTIYRFEPSYESQIGQANPLRPGQSAILIANITEDLPDVLESVRIGNRQCPAITLNQEV